MSEQPSAGSSTANAATPATSQGPPPSRAAVAPQPAENTKRPEKERTQRNFAARQIATTSQSSSGASRLLSAVADLPFSAVRRDSPTYIVPTFVQFFYVLYLMDAQMVHTKRFTDANHDWMPFVSQLYFTVLIYYHVLVCQKIGGTISIEQGHYLDYLEENYVNLSNYKIPGPLVPFFQALAANGGPNSDFGNVIFGIPSNMSVSQSSQYLLPERINFNLPSPIVILDQFMAWVHIVAPMNAVAPQLSLSMTDYFYSHFFNQPIQANDDREICMLTPSARFPVPMTMSIVQNFQASVGTWHSSLPFDTLQATTHSQYTTGNNANPLNFAQYLGFQGVGSNRDRMYDWFTQCSRIMQPYADFFRDSVSIGAISTVGIGSIYVMSFPANTTANARVYTSAPTIRAVRHMTATVNRYEMHSFNVNNTVGATHVIEYLDLVTEQLGYLTQLNFNWTLINGNTNTVYPGPVRGHYATGPVEALPDYRQRTPQNVANALPTLISGYFHTPAALKFE